MRMNGFLEKGIREGITAVLYKFLCSVPQITPVSLRVDKDKEHLRLPMAQNGRYHSHH